LEDDWMRHLLLFYPDDCGCFAHKLELAIEDRLAETMADIRSLFADEKTL